LVEVGPQVFDVFESDRHPQQPVADAGGLPVGGCEDSVVSDAGCWISVSTLPRLTAGVISRTVRTTARASLVTSNEINAPPPSICPGGRFGRRAG